MLSLVAPTGEALQILLYENTMTIKAFLFYSISIPFYFTSDNILQFGFCTEHSYLGNIHVKDILNKDLSTPLIYICSTVYKMAKILTQKYLLQSFFHITCIFC